MGNNHLTFADGKILTWLYASGEKARSAPSCLCFPSVPHVTDDNRQRCHQDPGCSRQHEGDENINKLLDVESLKEDLILQPNMGLIHPQHC